MNVKRLLYLVAITTILGCGGPLGKWEIKRDVVLDINAGREGQYETIVKDGVEYHIEHSGAYPAISWPVGLNRLEATLNNVGDLITYGDIDALQGNRYTFIKECVGEDIVFHPSVDSTIYPVIFRIFEYTDKTTSYIFRDVRMDGYKFKDFIVVRSWHKSTGNYSHSIIQSTNKRAEIKYCAE